MVESALVPAEIRQLVHELVGGFSGLPSARDRWVALLTDPSPSVRLQAERSLLSLGLSLGALTSAPSAPPLQVGETSSHRVLREACESTHTTWDEPTDPWRHCRECLGDAFWFDAFGEPRCLSCHPPRVS
jgi:hypothetical protein